MYKFYFKLFVCFLALSNLTIMTRRQLYDIMNQCKAKNINKKLEYFENVLLSRGNYSEEQKHKIKHKISYIKSEIKRRWIAAHSKADIFLKKINV